MHTNKMKSKNHSRREFLLKVGLGSVGLISLSRNGISSFQNSVFTRNQNPDSLIGLQLYTVRDAMASDLRGCLKQVKEIGYSYVELAGYSDGKFYGLEPDEFKKITDDIGLTIISSHTAVEKQGITADNAKIMAEAHAKINAKYCVQPWIEPKDRTLESYYRLIELFNKSGELMKQYNINFAYHNHNFDFDTVDGKIPFFDIFLKESDPNYLNFEMDLYWTVKASQDPIKIFNDYPGRFPLWHVKDMENSGDKFFAPVGTGTIDFKAIFNSKEKAGLKYFFVEQDATRNNKPFDAIKTSYDNMVNKILVQ
jgi:sugar phosphate isomerase/epimerase